METTLTKGDQVGVVVDGECFTGIITRRMFDGGYFLVKIPFYYSLSEKHGKPVKRNTLTVKQHIDELVF